MVGGKKCLFLFLFFLLFKKKKLIFDQKKRKLLKKEKKEKKRSTNGRGFWYGWCNTRCCCANIYFSSLVNAKENWAGLICGIFKVFLSVERKKGVGWGKRFNLFFFRQRRGYWGYYRTITTAIINIFRMVLINVWSVLMMRDKSFFFFYEGNNKIWTRSRSHWHLGE